MKRWHKLTLALLLAVVVVLGMGRVLGARQARQAQASAAPKAPAMLELAPTDLLPVRRGELAQTLAVSGSLVAVNSAFVKARVAAEVKRVAVREGDSVRAGQLLAQLDPMEYELRLRQAEQQAQSARAQLDIALRALQNSRSLVSQGFISPTALDNAVATEAGAQATLQAALAAVDLARKSRADTTVNAPIAGFVSQRLVQPGERVPVDAKLLEIVDLSRLELQASVTPESAGLLRVGAKARLKVDGIDGDIGARVVRINPSAQAGSRAVITYLELDPNPALRQGLFARGTIELERRQALQVAADAVRHDQAQPYALRLTGSTLVLAPLRLGLRGQSGGVEAVEVLDGLADGDRVLAGHLGAMRDGAAVRVGETQLSATPSAASQPR